MSAYPLYDVPYLVREPNDSYMSKKRHEIEVRNQAIVDDFFIARDKGLNHRQARIEVATKHQLTEAEVERKLVWFYQEAKRRKKIRFLGKIRFLVIHIV